MQNIIMVLIFVAMLLAFVVIVVRTARYEKYLKELEKLDLLNENLKSYLESLKGEAGKKGEEYLFEIKEELKKLKDVVEKLGRQRIQDRDTQVRDNLESVLLGMGYSKIKILGNADELSSPGPKEIQVECYKADIIHKGTVVIDSGRIVECRIKPAYEMFP